MSAIAIQEEIIDEATVSQSTDVLTFARGLVISDQAGYNLATERLRGIVDLRKQIVAKFKLPKERAYESHKAITAFEKETLAPVAEAETLIKARVGEFVEAQNREQRRLEAEARAEAARIQAEADRVERERQDAARKQIEEERLALATQIQADGGSDEEVSAVFDAPIEVPYVAPVAIALPVPVAPTFAAAKGISVGHDYSAEVMDLNALVKFAATSPMFASLVMANQTGLNSLARNQKESFALPGVRLVKKPRTSVR